MLRFLKKNKKQNWEIDLLKNILEKLPHEYHQFLDQIKDGIYKGIRKNASDIAGYCSFKYEIAVYKKYELKKERNYKITNIQVFDLKSSSFLNYTVYFSDGVINGFSIECEKKYNIDLNKFDVSTYKKIFLDTHDYSLIQNILSVEEKKLINPSDVYLQKLEGKDYFHIFELDDGDFIGIDIKKNVYHITHDPYEINLIEKNLKDVFNQFCLGIS